MILIAGLRAQGVIGDMASSRQTGWLEGVSAFNLSYNRGCWVKKWVLLLIGMFFLNACASTSNPGLASQMKITRDYFKSVSFTALVDFHVHGNHFVDPNGKPLSGKDQSKRRGSKGLLTKNYAVAKGEQGYIFYIAQKKDRLVAASVSKSKGMAAAWNPSNIEVHYPRPITEKDLTPESLARAFSSLMVIQGLEPDSELNNILDELDKPLE